MRVPRRSADQERQTPQQLASYRHRLACVRRHSPVVAPPQSMGIAFLAGVLPTCVSLQPSAPHQKARRRVRRSASSFGGRVPADSHARRQVWVRAGGWRFLTAAGEGRKQSKTRLRPPARQAAGPSGGYFTLGHAAATVPYRTGGSACHGAASSVFLGWGRRFFTSRSVTSHSRFCL
jgi:hypothetical protein